jgi:hypothetical protein
VRSKQTPHAKCENQVAGKAKEVPGLFGKRRIWDEQQLVNAIAYVLYEQGSRSPGNYQAVSANKNSLIL